jgi:AcrR family transcriptional regulator
MLNEVSNTKNIKLDDQGTKERLLSTALRMFAESGFDAVSIRDITNAAGANLGAIGYYFGSKDGLIKAVMVRAEPLNALRLQSLKACERDAGERAPSVEGIVRALVEPAVRFAKDSKGDGPYFSRIYSIASALRPPLVLEILRAQYDVIALRFIDALSRALPDVPRTVIVWRYIATVGAMLQVIDDASFLNRVPKFSKGRADSSNPDQIINELVPFLVGAITAQCSPQPTRKPGSPKRSGKQRTKS